MYKVLATPMRTFGTPAILLILTCFLVFTDLYSKHFIRQEGGFYVCNTGIAFGFVLPNYFFWPIYAIFFAAILCFLVSTLALASPFNLITLSLLLILSGSIANSADRITHGCVADFISLFTLPFPFFNLADSYICLGFALLAYKYLFRRA